MMAILGTIRPLAIIAAPSVGGLLGNYFGWRNVFIMLSSWGECPHALLYCRALSTNAVPLNLDLPLPTW